MSYSKITIHRSPKVNGLLHQLPYDVERRIASNLNKGKEQKLFISIISRKPRTQLKFGEGFFNNIHMSLTGVSDRSHFEFLSDDTVACYYPQNIKQISEMELNNNVDVTFWVVDFDDEDINGGYAEVARKVKGFLIPVINYPREVYDELLKEKDGTNEYRVKLKADEIERDVIQKGDVLHVCLSDAPSLEVVAEKLISKFSGSRRVYTALTICNQYITDEMKRRAENAYANEILKEINIYYNTLDDEKKKELTALVHEHLDEYVKGAKKSSEDDIISTVVNVASTAATAAVTSIDSLFKTIKSKF